MTKNKVAEFNNELESFLETMGKKYNFICKKSYITYYDSGMKITAETADLDSNGNIEIDYITEARIASALAPYRAGYHKEFNHYMGLTFKAGDKINKIVGYNTRARTYPIELEGGTRANPQWVAEHLIKNGLFVLDD